MSHLHAFLISALDLGVNDQHYVSTVLPTRVETQTPIVGLYEAGLIRVDLYKMVMNLTAAL